MEPVEPENGQTVATTDNQERARYLAPHLVLLASANTDGKSAIGSVEVVNYGFYYAPS